MYLPKKISQIDFGRENCVVTFFFIQVLIFFSVPPTIRVYRQVVGGINGSFAILQVHSGPENLKKSKQKKLVKSNLNKKKLFREIAFLAVLNFFPVQKFIFEIEKKWIVVKKIFFYFTSFLLGLF